MITQIEKKIYNKSKYYSKRLIIKFVHEISINNYIIFFYKIKPINNKYI